MVGEDGFVGDVELRVVGFVFEDVVGGVGVVFIVVVFGVDCIVVSVSLMDCVEGVEGLVFVYVYDFC